MLCDVLEINAEPRKLKCQTSYSLMLVNAVFVFGCTQATLEGEGGEGERGGREGEDGRGRMGRASKGSVSRYLLPNPANLSPFQEIKIRNFFRLPV